MEDRFTELARVMSEKQLSDIDSQMQNVKAERDMINEGYGQQLSELKVAYSQQKMGAQQIKAQQKKEKLQKDLIKSMVDSGLGDDLGFAEGGIDGFAGQPVAPEAQGLPIIEGLA